MQESSICFFVQYQEEPLLHSLSKKWSRS